MAETLEMFAQPQRVLMVFAHPDDAEYGASAAVAAWTRQGAEVAYLLLTAGEAGMQIPPAEVAPIRALEQRAACDVVGASELTILNHPDGMLEANLDLRRDIARVIRQFKPDVVVTGTWQLEPGWGLNHADHRAVGIATVDAVRDADNTWVFPELAANEELPKWGATWLLATGDPNPTVAVEVTEGDVAKAVASLEAHEAYLAALPDHPKPAVFIPEILTGGGQAAGVEYASVFRAWKLR